MKQATLHKPLNVSLQEKLRKVTFICFAQASFEHCPSLAAHHQGENKYTIKANLE